MGMALDESQHGHAAPERMDWDAADYLHAAAARQVTFEVSGLPVSQGSMRAFVVKGHAVITSSSKSLGQWRQLVALKAQDVAAREFDGPIAIDLAFRLPKPKSAPKRKRLFATKRPDLDKLIRAVLDSLTHVLIKDDAQVIQISAVKDYGPPGVTVKITQIVDQA